MTLLRIACSRDAWRDSESGERQMRPSVVVFFSPLDLNQGTEKRGIWCPMDSSSGRKRGRRREEEDRDEEMLRD